MGNLVDLNLKRKFSIYLSKLQEKMDRYYLENYDELEEFQKTLYKKVKGINFINLENEEIETFTLKLNHLLKEKNSFLKLDIIMNFIYLVSLDKNFLNQDEEYMYEIITSFMDGAVAYNNYSKITPILYNSVFKERFSKIINKEEYLIKELFEIMVVNQQDKAIGIVLDKMDSKIKAQLLDPIFKRDFEYIFNYYNDVMQKYNDFLPSDFANLEKLHYFNELSDERKKEFFNIVEDVRNYSSLKEQCAILLSLIYYYDEDIKGDNIIRVKWGVKS